MEVQTGDRSSAIAVFVPFPQYAHFQKLIKEKGLIQELEKKFSGKHVVIFAQVRRDARRHRVLGHICARHTA